MTHISMPRFPVAALKALAVAAALACGAGTSSAADNATLRITSFSVAAAEFSGTFAWAVDAYQSYDIVALDAGGLAFAATDLYSADDWALGLNRVQAQTDTRNHASARVLEKLGFIREGTLREDCVVDGDVSDSWVYGLIERDWPPRAR